MKSPSIFACAAAIAVVVAAAGLPIVASANREHRVREGQTLSAIARRYDVGVTSLAAANGINRGASLRVGQVLSIPEEGVVFVQSGQTLSSIANAHHVALADLLRANRLRASSNLRVGQRLVLPGHEVTERRSAYGPAPRNQSVRIIRANPSRSMRMPLVDSRGRVRDAARRRLAVLMEHRSSHERHLPNRRLLSVITQISNHFGGRQIYLISGYRPAGGYTRETSRHTAGDAVDIRIQGVPNTELRDFCRSLSRTGCGYYPRSTFVHVDVRERSTYWVDWSGPGERPDYRRAGAESADSDDSEGSEDSAITEEESLSAAAE